MHPVEEELLDAFEKLRHGVINGFGATGINMSDLHFFMLAKQIPDNQKEFYVTAILTVDSHLLKYSKKADSKDKSKKGADTFDDDEEED